jgi:hypothetical protein
MRSALKIFAVLAFGIAIGAVVTAILVRPAIPNRWFVLEKKSSELSAPSGSSVLSDSAAPISLGNEMFTGSDILPLSVKSISGRAKFLEHTAASDSRCALGYVVEIWADPLDLSKVPEKYKKEKVIPSKSGPITVLPIEQATYEVIFYFCLRDRDGFELVTIASPVHNVESGRKTEIQAQTEHAIPYHIASKVASVGILMHIKKCVTANDE